MTRSRYLSVLLLISGTTCLSAGCLALSFGGKTQTIDHAVAESPETISRIDQLESRVQALEQQISPQPQISGVHSMSKK